MKPVMIGAAVAALVFVTAQPVTAQPASAPAAQEAPSARKLQLARQLVAATRMDASMAGMFRNMATQGMASMSASLSPDAKARVKLVGDAEGNALAKLVPQLVELMVNGYARTFSEKELSDMLAFYQTPSGRSMVAKTPQLMQGMMSGLVGLMPQMRRDMGQEICAKETCTAAQKAAFFGASPAKN